jgi:hypothetical protein
MQEDLEKDWQSLKKMAASYFLGLIPFFAPVTS